MFYFYENKTALKTQPKLDYYNVGQPCVKTSEFSQPNSPFFLIMLYLRPNFRN